VCSAFRVAIKPCRAVRDPNDDLNESENPFAATNKAIVMVLLSCDQEE